MAPKLLPAGWGSTREHAGQAALVRSKARFRVVAAGRRSGKSHQGKRRLVKCCLFPPPGVDKPTFAAAAPTRDQAKRIFWEDLKRLCPRSRVDVISESELTIRFTNGSILMVVGLDRPQRIEGIALDGIVIDEIAEVKRESWEQSIRPALSTPGRPPGWAWFTGRPKGRGLFYDLYSNAGVKEGWESFTWTSATIVDPAEIEQARRDLDPLTFAQEYEAAWVTFEGLAYYQWNPTDHLRRLEYDPSKPIAFCFDFNVEPGVAAIIQEQLLPGEIENRTCVIGEVHIPRNSNTPAVCRKLAQDWGHHTGDVFYFGDASGGARHTSQENRKSDWDLVREVLRPVFGDRLRDRVPRRNPAVRDRINAMNSRMRSTSGVVRFAVDPGKAPNVVKDFEGVTLLKGGSGEIDKKGCEDRGLTHMCLARGTMVAVQGGAVPIESLRIGDLVATRTGYHPVTAIALAERDAPLMLLVTTSGKILHGTANHPVWLEGRGFVRMDEIKQGNVLCAIESDSVPHARPDGATTTESTTSHAHAQSAASCSPSTDSERRAHVVVDVVACCEPTALRADVFDICVDVAHEFFANGVLVSNSDAIGYYVHEKFPVAGVQTSIY